MYTLQHSKVMLVFLPVGFGIFLASLHAVDGLRLVSVGVSSTQLSIL